MAFGARVMLHRWSRCFASVRGHAVPRFGGQVPNVRKLSRPRPAARRLSAHIEAAVVELQGEWGDDEGLEIRVAGREVTFGDDGSSYALGESNGVLTLCGARLVGPTSAPTWKLPSGEECHWARAAPSAGDALWAAALFGFKEDRLRIRRQLRDAFAEHDFESVSSLKESWQRGCATEGLSESQNRALAAGQSVVPGSCFVHRKFGYRGVVLSCDPWCLYPAAWRAKWVPNRPQGETQPFYHCLVDERDRPGGQSRYVAEENIEPSDVVFPLESPLVELLLVPCNELGCYLPGQRLEDALQRQRAGGDFVL